MGNIKQIIFDAIADTAKMVAGWIDFRIILILAITAGTIFLMRWTFKK